MIVGMILTLLKIIVVFSQKDARDMVEVIKNNKAYKDGNANIVYCIIDETFHAFYC